MNRAGKRASHRATVMPRRLAAAAILAGATVLATSPALAAQDKDWPCVQPYMAHISPAQVWSGTIADPGKLHDDEAINTLALRLAARRVPLEEADKLIDDFAKTQKPTAVNDRLALLFGRTLEAINADRASIINGLNRFTGGQRKLSERIRENRAKLEDQHPTGEAAQTLTEMVQWDERLFAERQHSLTYLCNQPVVLEHRAFALGRAMSEHLEK